MEPTLGPGDWLLIWRGIWPGRTPHVRPGQIVVTRHPHRPELLLIKRASRREPGGWWLTSDNTALHPASSHQPAAVVIDSTRFGAVPAQLIEGRVLLRYHRGPVRP